MTAGSEVAALLAVVPRWIVASVEREGAETVEEIELDLGRAPRLHFHDRVEPVVLSREVSREDLQYVLGRVTRFREDNRTGIDRTLHRIACIRDRYHEIVGFTFRIGRVIGEAAQPLHGLLETRRNVLVVGRPGAGKTTVLRSAAAILSDQLHRRVVIADTSNEIGGDGQVPHPAIGSARRLQIPLPDHERLVDTGARQAGVILQAVINHHAETIIVDELGFAADAQIARTIARRGIQLIATAHGASLRDVIFNSELACLVGDLQTIVLSPEEIERRGMARHTILERTGPPVFDCAVEIVRRGVFVIHPDVAESVDALLRELPGTGPRTTEQDPSPAAPNQMSQRSRVGGARGAGSGEVV
jgi:stage III sporulation protein SpoIIIAA